MNKTDRLEKKGGLGDGGAAATVCIERKNRAIRQTDRQRKGEKEFEREREKKEKKKKRTRTELRFNIRLHKLTHRQSSGIGRSLSLSLSRTRTYWMKLSLNEARDRTQMYINRTRRGHTGVSTLHHRSSLTEEMIERTNEKNKHHCLAHQSTCFRKQQGYGS